MIKKMTITILICFILGMITPVSAGFRDLKIGRLWHSIEDGGGMGWYNSNHLAGRYPFVWPAPRSLSNPFLYRRWEIPSCASESYFIISAPNWTNQEGESIPVATYWAGANSPYFPPITLSSRAEPPMVTVDGLVVSDPWPPTPSDKVDPNIPSDQMTHLGVRTALGVDVIQKVYAYTNRHFWDFLIFDYTFTNTGKLDVNEETVIPDQVLEEFYAHFTFRGAITREGHNRIANWGEWIDHEFIEYYEPEKSIFVWDGDSRDFGIDDAGDPDPITGHWLSSQYFGMVHLHADKSETDDSNDAAQPLGSTWKGYSKIVDLSKSEDQAYWLSHFCSDFHREPEWQGSGGNPTWEGGNPNWHGENQANGYLNYGPYRLENGQDVRIVLAYAAGGLSPEMSAQYGAEYMEKGEKFFYMNPKIGPPGFTGLDAKHALLNSGRDSLFQTASMARWLYEHDFNCPDPPMSPSLSVKSSGGKIIIEWGDEPEQIPDPDTGVMDFEGYRVYRSIGKWDTTLTGWEKIYEGTDHRYDDSDIPRGVATYYYVTAYDDGSQTVYGPNDIGLVDGEKLESSPFWNMTTVPAYKLKEPDNNLSMVDVVPNPYNIHGSNNFPSEPNKVLFVNLTPFCTINIYTMTGDKIVTLEHTSGSAEEAWYQITESNQYVTSGIYLYHIIGKTEEGMTTGEETTGKLIIVR